MSSGHIIYYHNWIDIFANLLKNANETKGINLYNETILIQKSLDWIWCIKNDIDVNINEVNTTQGFKSVFKYIYYINM